MDHNGVSFALLCVRCSNQLRFTVIIQIGYGRSDTVTGLQRLVVTGCSYGDLVLGPDRGAEYTTLPIGFNIRTTKEIPVHRFPGVVGGSSLCSPGRNTWFEGISAPRHLTLQDLFAGLSIQTGFHHQRWAAELRDSRSFTAITARKAWGL